jgi:hypothetical protein
MAIQSRRGVTTQKLSSDAKSNLRQKNPLPCPGYSKRDRLQFIRSRFLLKASFVSCIVVDRFGMISGALQVASLSLNDQNALAEMESAIAAIISSATPDFGSQRGIIICGGGLRYFPCAWVCIKILRHLGCRLPIEPWHLGKRKMPDALEAFNQRLNQ